MSWHRIWALFLRYLYATRDPMRITEFLFWPMIDIGFFGLLALWSGSIAQQPDIIRIFITGLVLWQVIYRANYEICANMMDEFLERNLVNIIASPLKKGEWIVSMMLSGLLKISFTILFGTFVGWLFFRVNVFGAGWMLAPLISLCLLSGWIIGFIGAGIIIFFGPKLQSLPWVVIMGASIISAVFYPVHILPIGLRHIAQAFPMSYIFQAMREVLTSDIVSYQPFLIGGALSIFYLFIAIAFFHIMFEKNRKNGFVKSA